MSENNLPPEPQGNPERGEDLKPPPQKRTPGWVRDGVIGIASVAVIVFFGYRIMRSLDIDRDEVSQFILGQRHWILIVVGMLAMLQSYFRRRKLPALIGLVILCVGAGQLYLRTCPVRGFQWSRNETPMQWIPAGSISFTNKLGQMQTVTAGNGFWIDRYEFSGRVSRDRWDRRSRWMREEMSMSFLSVVNMVSWYDAMDNVESANNAASPAVRISGLEYRLPTVDEWIYACLYAREKNGAVPVGPVFQDGTRSGPETRIPVRHNSYYLYDMTGNLWEWCQDATTPPLPTIEPEEYTGVRSRPYRAAIGGSWNSPEDLCTPDSIISLHAGDMFRYVGFRLVLAPSEKNKAVD